MRADFAELVSLKTPAEAEDFFERLVADFRDEMTGCTEEQAQHLELFMIKHYAEALGEVEGTRVWGLFSRLRNKEKK